MAASVRILDLQFKFRNIALNYKIRITHIILNFKILIRAYIEGQNDREIIQKQPPQVVYK